MKPYLLLPLIIILFIITVLWASDIVLLDPPPDGYEYGKPEPVNVGGQAYWIGNRLVEIKPTFWHSLKAETVWIVGIAGTVLGVLGGLLKLGVLHLPGKNKQ